VKSIPIVAVILAMRTFSGIGYAQTFSGPPGVPGTPISPNVSAIGTANFGTQFVDILPLPLITYTPGVSPNGLEPTDWDGGSSAGGSPPDTAYTAVPGDVVLLSDPNGGDALANWQAVARFFNPGDPDGSLGLAATEDQAFLPADVGPAGFATFQLLPNTVYLPGTAYPSLDEIEGTYGEFGPVDAIPLGRFTQTIVEISTIAIPEPNSICVLILTVAALLMRRRSRAV